MSQWLFSLGNFKSFAKVKIWQVGMQPGILKESWRFWDSMEKGDDSGVNNSTGEL